MIERIKRACRRYCREQLALYMGANGYTKAALRKMPENILEEAYAELGEPATQCHDYERLLLCMDKYYVRYGRGFFD